mmetsp:Transcript_37097/g.73447  ORF Transcript_37097/g.73447 Transcript_37097/m.73447 type:complete len:207 (+) Transcript_37097:861-1481(+)
MWVPKMQAIAQPNEALVQHLRQVWQSCIPMLASYEAFHMLLVVQPYQKMLMHCEACLQPCPQQHVTNWCSFTLEKAGVLHELNLNHHFRHIHIPGIYPCHNKKLATPKGNVHDLAVMRSARSINGQFPSFAQCLKAMATVCYINGGVIQRIASTRSQDQRIAYPEHLQDREFPRVHKGFCQRCQRVAHCNNSGIIQEIWPGMRQSI